MGGSVVNGRGQLHAMWSSVAASWAEHAEYVDSRGAPVAAAMIAATTPAKGDRVLELACGPGGVGLEVAPQVAPGEVVLSDVAPEMAAIAAQRAAALGLANVSTLVLDLEAIEQPGASYDVVLCREGLMFASDPAAAVGEMSRVLRPGGRLAAAVWGPRSRNPWLGAVLDAVSAYVGSPIPPPGVPGPFSLDDADRLAAILAAADLTDVGVAELPMPLRVGSFDQWWERTSALAGPLAKVLAALPAEAVSAIRLDARQSVRAYETADGFEFPGVSLLATARRS
jgi:SAM-dependent methyltransferase